MSRSFAKQHESTNLTFMKTMRLPLEIAMLAIAYFSQKVDLSGFENNRLNYKL
jgi:hypothetical protein